MSTKFTNAYIFRFAAIMVVIVAAVLSLAAIFLQPYQERNIRIEKKQAILKAVSIIASVETVEEKYDKYIISEIIINSEGVVEAEYKNKIFEKGNKRAFDVDMDLLGKQLAKYKQNKKKGNLEFPVFQCLKEGKAYYIVPVVGKGLWGPIWGNLAFSDDMNTIVGATFAHKGETPGLGAEINTDWFGNQFVGKRIFDEKGAFVSVKVIKGGVANSLINPMHGVDAISGGTITSNALSMMLEDCLVNYVPYFKKIKK